MADLAMTWKSLGRDQDAIELMRVAVELYTKVLGSEDPRTAKCVEALEQWTYQSGDVT